MERLLPLREAFASLRLNRSAGVELLYNSCYNKMYGIAFSVVRNEQTSEDIVHNVCYKLLTMDAALLPASNEAAWLYSVVKNEALSALRKESRLIPSDAVKEIAFTDKSIDDYVDTDAFYSMIKSLDDTRKTVVTLKILGGFTHKEIAQMLNKPVGTVQWIYNTSVKKLKAVLYSLLCAVVATFVAAFARGVVYYQNLSASADSGSSSGGFYIDRLFVAITVILVALTVTLIVFIKNSYKLPTKATAKRV